MMGMMGVVGGVERVRASSFVALKKVVPFRRQTEGELHAAFRCDASNPLARSWNSGRVIPLYRQEGWLSG